VLLSSILDLIRQAVVEFFEAQIVSFLSVFPDSTSGGEFFFSFLFILKHVMDVAVALVQELLITTCHY
jgi:hypothetical protein